jgi:eukaryotic-like serine/threonine-protein kinase
MLVAKEEPMATPNARARQTIPTNTATTTNRVGQSRELLNYRLGDRIGQEELATLYRGVHLTLDRPVQIAVLRRSDWVSVSRFQLAMRLGAKLSHPSLLPVIDAGHDPHYGDYLVTPRLDTHALSELLANGPLPELVALRIFVQLGQALEYLHGQSVVHRDLQPANILVSAQGATFLTNFSLASSPETPDFSGVHEADYRTIYSAPELDFTSNRINPAQDLYSLGAITYHMFTGERPPRAGADLSILVQRNPALAPAERVITRLMSPDPGQRFASAGQAVVAMNQALRALRDEATEDMEESRWEPIAEWLDNPLEQAIGDRLDAEFIAKSRARADSIHRVDAIKRILDRWSRKGFLRRQLLGQVIQPEQIVSYNVYLYELKAHYERRTAPEVQQVVYTGAQISQIARKVSQWDAVLPEYEPFEDSAPEHMPIPGSRRLVACPDCNGAKKLPCKTCAGKGTMSRNRKVTDADGQQRSESFEENCPTCHGYGQRDCGRCQSFGQLMEEEVFTWSRFGKLLSNSDDLSGLHEPSIKSLAQPIYRATINPDEPQWMQVQPLREVLERARATEGGDARLKAAELIIRGVPVTEVDYQMKEKPHTLALIGFDQVVRGDNSLVDMERLGLYLVIVVLVILVVLFVIAQFVV